MKTMEHSVPRLKWQAFVLSKEGNTLEECEDAFGGRVLKGRFVIADGASESAFAGLWARILVKTFLPREGSWPERITRARDQWRSTVANEKLPWFLETKVEEGAFAALLAVTFFGTSEGSCFQAQATGDCCLFHTRGAKLLHAFPVTQSADFSNRPSLLCSQPWAKEFEGDSCKFQTKWAEGDCLWLMSDALALWFLQQVESQATPWAELEAIKTAPDFAAWIAQARQSKELRNDDVTLVRIETLNDPTPEVSESGLVP